MNKKRVSPLTGGNVITIPKNKRSVKMAEFGHASTANYKKTFFEAHPDLEGKVIVHHTVEQQVLTRYPGIVTEEEMHSLENLRGIPHELNSDLHLSRIRKEWNRFYKENQRVTKDQLLKKATEIDEKYTHLYKPPKEWKL
ncbi:MAG: hypothetical protein DRI57_03870 [Deltaproteobacteria bacterium]|nr:MAG: hypothetical protein DRI57_03870 [Deltaproteobacteria bacterium]